MRQTFDVIPITKEEIKESKGSCGVVPRNPKFDTSEATAKGKAPPMVRNTDMVGKGVVSWRDK